jgi:glutamine synthetase
VVFGVTLTGGEPDAVFGPLLPADYRDLALRADLATAVPLPGREDRVSVICEPEGWLGRPGREPLPASALSVRAALRRVLAQLERAGLRATVAPELEFFLLERGADGVGLRPAAVPGGSGSREWALEIASLERAAHFGPYFDALFAACARQRIPVTGYAHESAWGQYEVNFAPGEPLAMADAVWRFKRLARETAVRQGFLASFIAKPFADQPGTGLHWHASLQHHGGPRDGANAFTDAQGRDRPTLAQFIGGLQAQAPASLALLAPWAHSFERLQRSDASPTAASWGEDDRGVAYRLPAASAANRRVELRLPGGDASPYLTLALLLGGGLQGMARELPRLDEPPALPTTLDAALTALDASASLRELLGDPLVDLFVALKRHELAERAALADPGRNWDLRHLVEQA